MNTGSGSRRKGTIAVAIHDVEPATFARCALIRDWLDDHGIGRATLLVIPASDMHPIGDRSPELVRWLRERACHGDVIAQHGFQHRQMRRASPARQALAHWQGGGAAEFAGLDITEAHRAVQAGRRVLCMAGIEPHGFVAPAYAYTPALREALRGWFGWWATLMRVHGTRTMLSPALTLGTSTHAKRLTSPLLVRGGALVAGRHLRLDLHPADFDHHRHARALERVLAGARGRTPVTYDELLAA